MKRLQDQCCKISLQILIYTSIILLSPIILTTLLSLYVYKCGILRLIIKYFKPKLLQELNEHDAFYATDRFWEDSRANFGLVLVLDGNISLEQIREDFFKQVIHATKDPSMDKLFPRLTEIPENFGGYYFWRKANYFLIHEHIRPIQGPIDEVGLKKFAGTVLTLPFPNKRPLWEILVCSSYSKQNQRSNHQPHEVLKKKDECIEDSQSTTKQCSSALVIRMHSCIADPDEIMKMVALLCNKNSYSLQSLKLPDCVNNTNSLKNNGPFTVQESNRDTTNTTTGNLIRTLLKLPKTIHIFMESIFWKDTCLKNIYSCDNNPATISWTGLNYPLISKIVHGQGITNCSAISVSILLEALTSPLDGLQRLQIQASSKRHETEELCDDMNNVGESCKKKNEEEEDDKSCDAVPIMMIPTMCSIKCSENHSDNELIFLKNVLLNDDRLITSRVQDINRQLDIENSQCSISRWFLKFLTLFPHPFVRYVNFHWVQGALILFQECKSDLSQLLITRISQIPNDVIFIREHQLLDVIPLCGLQLRHTAVAATAIKFQNALKISVTINSSLLQEISSSQRTESIRSTNTIIDKQNRVDQIVNSLGMHLDLIYKDGKDEHGFVRIPI